MLAVYSGREIETGLRELRERSEGALAQAEPDVRRIIDRVASGGDRALLELTAELDGVELSPDRLRVSPKEMDRATETIDPGLKKALVRARDNIIAFHRRQLRNSWFQTGPDGSVSGIRFVPVDSAGLYVPGGRASYPSTVLMTALPPRVAGVERLVLVTPPGPGGGIAPAVLAAARLAEVDEVYRIGGAQAIAALALGTETIRPVDKVVGPGNVYVSMAKKLLYGRVGIDMIAGPSEILILADSTADPLYIACDLISQAEHDPLASAVLVTADGGLIAAVNREMKREAQKSPRAEIVTKSLRDFGRVFLTEDMAQAIDLVNRIAPEHLEIQTREPWELLGLVRNAGTVFLGHHTPEALGDYLAGVNHVLPTTGTARFASGLGVDDFVKRIQILSYPAQAMEGAIDDIARLAEAEGLDGHARSVRARRRKPEGKRP